MEPRFKTETGYYVDNQDGTFTFVNSGQSTTFLDSDLARMILDGERVFELGEEKAMIEDGIDPDEVAADGGGYVFSDEDGMIHGRDITHAIDEELVDYLDNETSGGA